MRPLARKSLPLSDIFHASFLHLSGQAARKFSTNSNYVARFTIPESVSGALYEEIYNFQKLRPSRKEIAKKGELEDWQLNKWYEKLLLVSNSVDPTFTQQLDYIKNKNSPIIILDGINSGRFEVDNIPTSIPELQREEFWRAAYPANILSYFYNKVLGSKRVGNSWVFASEKDRDNITSYRNGGNLELHNDGWEWSYFNLTSFYCLVGSEEVITIFITSKQIIDYYLAKGEEGRKMLDELSKDFCMGGDIYSSDLAPILDEKGSIRFSKSAAITGALTGIKYGQDEVIKQFCNDLQEISPALDICIREKILVRFRDDQILHGRVVSDKEKASVKNPKANRLLFREHSNQK